MNKILVDKSGKHKLTEVFSSKLFYIGLTVKIILSLFFASEYLKEYFFPFINAFVENGFMNPYQYFYEKGQTSIFPYPGFMLWIMTIPRVLFSFLPYTEFNFAHSLVLRLPLLFFDFSILIILCRWLKNHTKKVLIYYWLSPVRIYISYIHGQLDVIAIAMVFITLYFLFRRKHTYSAVSLGLALATKSNIAVIIPFYFIFLYRQKIPSLKILKYFFVFLIFSILPSVFFWSEGFYQIVYNNSVQSRIFDIYISFFSTTQYLIIPAIFFLLLIKALKVTHYSRDKLLLFLSLCFGLIILLVKPMPGWYYWIIPFLIYYIVRRKIRITYTIGLLQFIYFLYFIIFPANINENIVLNEFINGLAQFNHEQIQLFHNLLFTVLQTSLSIQLYWIFKDGIFKSSDVIFGERPYIVAIAGDSGAGKSQLTRSVVDVFGNSNTTIISGDDTHRWERGDKNWQSHTHLNPKANHLYGESHTLTSLKGGSVVKRKCYNHDTGKFDLTEKLIPKNLIISEGLHTLYLENQRSLSDLKIFLAPSEELRYQWKIKRDSTERGKTKEQAIEQIKKRESDGVKYIKSQRKFADIVIEYQNLENSGANNELGLKLYIANKIYLEPLIKELEKIESLSVIHEYINEVTQLLSIQGKVSAKDIDVIAYQNVTGLEENGIYKSNWQDDLCGVLQLIISYSIFKTKALND